MSKKYQFLFTLEAESFEEASNVAARILIEHPEVQGFRLETAPLKVEHQASEFPQGDRTAADYADAEPTNDEQGFED